ncbi:hypothetical protein TrVE_jg1872 [Triparma verrucosa]|uniref:C2H2-type domain-containing protein n=2 Tax=Triparma TaxID=722752 RepID=A0A9W7BXR1_9STRA|nr:hypothetical protein TrVE_jg1872 [Triparma verrucosa]GMH95632.1 hypothetical protein TrST_g6796 [Triparma strigata]
MSFNDLQSASALSSLLNSSTPPYALVMYTATWCGPCNRVKPIIQQKVSSDWSKFSASCTFSYLYEDGEGVDVASYGVSAFPTFRLYKTGSGDPKDCLGEVKGGDVEGVQRLLEEHVKELFGANGNSMGGQALTGEDAREARLRRLAGGNNTAASPPAPPASSDTPMADAGEAVVKTLVEDMGFEETMAKKGVKNSNGTLEGAIDWITAHQDDPMDTEEEPSGAICMEAGKVSADSAIVKSYKCNDCGRILSSMANLELHANKSGHSDFSESTEEVKPLTEEEKKAKVEEIKQLLAAKKAQREEEEKKQNVLSEKQRRNMGKEMAKTREEMEKDERKRIIYAKKKEKEDAKKERERIRREIEADKLERRANKGKIKSSLGVDGYNPSAIQYDKDDGADAPVEKVSAIPKKTKTVDTRDKNTRMNDLLTKIGQHRAGGDGERCLNLLKTFIGNVVDNPTEAKYRGVNTAGKAYKSRIKGIVGAKKVLELCGWSMGEEEKLVLPIGEEDLEWMAAVRGKIEAEIVKFNNDF